MRTPTPETLRAQNADLDRRVFDLQALLKAGAALHRELEVDALAVMVIAMVRERTGVERIALLLHDSGAGQVVVRAVHGLRDDLMGIQFPAEDGILWRLLLAGEPVSVVDLEGSPRFAEVFTRHRLTELEGLTWLPLVLHGQLIGLLSLAAALEGRTIGNGDVGFLTSLASHAAVAFNTAQVYERVAIARRELDRSMHKLSMLFDITRALGAVQNLKDLVRLILERAIQSVEAEKGSLMVLDEATDELVVRVVYGLPDKEMERRINDGEVTCNRFRRGEGVAGRVLESRKPIRVDDVERAPGFSPRSASNVRSILCVPLLVDDDCVGVLNFTNRKGNLPFRSEDEDILMALANQAAVAYARTRLYELAITDGLTKLYIRRYLMHRLAEEVKRSRRYRTPLAVVMCDIDHFKRVNDTWGHPAGDAVIVAVADALRNGLRTGIDVPARYGGEEFVLLLPETHGEPATVAAERLRARIEAASIDIGDGKMIQVTMSFGVAELVEEGDESGDRLLKRADEALYRSKQGGRNRVTLA